MAWPINMASGITKWGVLVVVGPVKAKAENASTSELAQREAGLPPSWAFDDEDDSSADALMGIAEVCELYKVSPRALRFYETKGLLAPRRINGTRVYNKVDRLEPSARPRVRAAGPVSA